jgi:uncharacterized membrane protein YhaH (DUF805 family)
MNWYLLVLKKYVEFNGRARRKEYWYFTLFSTLISIGLGIIAGVTNTQSIDSIYSLAVLVPTIAVGVRRMHDVGKNGWYIIIPFYNLVLACKEGTEGTNAYGSDPKRSELEDEIYLIGRN